HPNTRICVRLLCSCFKTGCFKLLCKCTRTSTELGRVPQSASCLQCHSQRLL
ncbi:hypothetical protein BDK51DRAFT_20204, partial [Blyttiomyces helicus]